MNERHVFVADLHLQRDHPRKTDGFLRFVSELPKRGLHLYVLGDLFDVWIGSVQLRTEPEWNPVVDALGDVVTGGGVLSFFHGNRDYCMGRYLTRAIGAETVPAAKTVEVDGHKIYLTHGDLLCTGDQLYHVARWFMRGPISSLIWKCMPTDWRYGFYSGYRRISKNQDPSRKRVRHGVNRTRLKRLARRGVEVIVCGHLHEHTDRVERFPGGAIRLITLPVWEEHGSFLEYVDGEFVLKRVDFA